MSIAERYHSACHIPSDINEHLATMVGLSDELHATKVIELGTRAGVSTIAWLYAMERHDGHLWSVDIDPAPALRHPRWTFLRGDDLDPSVVGALPDADIVFIDTSHAYEDTLSELNVYALKVRPGGRIVLHDTELRHPFGLRGQPPFPVKKAIVEFCREENLIWHNHPHCNGLGVIEIPEG